MSAHRKGIRRECRVYCHDATERNRLAVILLRVFHNVPVPQSEVCVCQADHRCVNIERQRIFDLVVFYVVVCVFIGDVCPAADATHQLMEFHLVHVLGETVEYHQFTGVQLVHYQTTHIGVIL